MSKEYLANLEFVFGRSSFWGPQTFEVSVVEHEDQEPDVEFGFQMTRGRSKSVIVVSVPLFDMRVGAFELQDVHGTVKLDHEVFISDLVVLTKKSRASDSEWLSLLHGVLAFVAFHQEALASTYGLDHSKMKMQMTSSVEELV